MANVSNSTRLETHDDSSKRSRRYFVWSLFLASALVLPLVVSAKLRITVLARLLESSRGSSRRLVYDCLAFEGEDAIDFWFKQWLRSQSPHFDLQYQKNSGFANDADDNEFVFLERQLGLVDEAARTRACMNALFADVSELSEIRYGSIFGLELNYSELWSEIAKKIELGSPSEKLEALTFLLAGIRGQFFDSVFEQSPVQKQLLQALSTAKHKVSDNPSRASDDLTALMLQLIDLELVERSEFDSDYAVEALRGLQSCNLLFEANEYAWSYYTRRQPSSLEFKSVPLSLWDPVHVNFSDVVSPELMLEAQYLNWIPPTLKGYEAILLQYPPTRWFPEMQLILRTGEFSLVEDRFFGVSVSPAEKKVMLSVLQNYPEDDFARRMTRYLRLDFEDSALDLSSVFQVINQGGGSYYRPGTIGQSSRLEPEQFKQLLAHLFELDRKLVERQRTWASFPDKYETARVFLLKTDVPLVACLFSLSNSKGSADCLLEMHVWTHLFNYETKQSEAAKRFLVSYLSSLPKTDAKRLTRRIAQFYPSCSSLFLQSLPKSTLSEAQRNRVLELGGKQIQRLEILKRHKQRVRELIHKNQRRDLRERYREYVAIKPEKPDLASTPAQAKARLMTIDKSESLSQENWDDLVLISRSDWLWAFHFLSEKLAHINNNNPYDFRIWLKLCLQFMPNSKSARTAMCKLLVKYTELIQWLHFGRPQTMCLLIEELTTELVKAEQLTQYVIGPYVDLTGSLPNDHVIESQDVQSFLYGYFSEQPTNSQNVQARRNYLRAYVAASEIGDLDDFELIYAFNHYPEFRQRYCHNLNILAYADLIDAAELPTTLMSLLYEKREFAIELFNYAVDIEAGQTKIKVLNNLASAGFAAQSLAPRVIEYLNQQPRLSSQQFAAFLYLLVHIEPQGKLAISYLLQFASDLSQPRSHRQIAICALRRYHSVEGIKQRLQQLKSDLESRFSQNNEPDYVKRVMIGTIDRSIEYMSWRNRIENKGIESFLAK